jgi:hypothetical protein
MKPQGSKWKAYFWPPTTSVCPAFAPPLNRTQSSAYMHNKETLIENMHQATPK